MSFFKRLFGKEEKKESASAGKQDDGAGKNIEETLNSLPPKEKALFEEMLSKMANSSNTPALFKEEFYDSINRYYSNPNLRVELDLTDEKGVTYQEHEAFSRTYNQWKEIQSVWDRRSVLFSHWDKSELEKLDKWQIVERFVKDRQALKALEFKEKYVEINDYNDIRLPVALSKLYRALNSYEHALHYARGSYELRPDLDIVKVEYANALHLSDSQADKDLAHSLMNEVLEGKIKQTDKDEIPLLNFFIFSNDYIDSSVFAVLFLNSGHCDAETWDKMAEEYYWCPEFRYEHAVFLSNHGEGLRALVKLNALANEFPWYKNGVLSSIDAIKQIRIQKKEPNFMKDEMAQLEKYKSMWGK